MDKRIDGTFQQRTRTIGMGALFAGIGLLAMVAMASYLTVRAILVAKADYAGAEVVVSIALLLAEMFVLVHAFGYVASVLRAIWIRPRVEAAVLTHPEDFPEVDVLIPARHEDRKILERTLTAVVGMSYPRKTVWLLDDSSEPHYSREADELARQFGIRVFRREVRHGAKAGIINDCLKQVTGKYVSIFDADQCPMPFFLNRIVPLLEANDQLAFVQTPQFYANIGENRVARAAGAQQAVFYEYICEAKGSSGAAFCCGTNVLFRREALTGVGGLDETSVTEDFATSVKLHSSGWKSLYYGEAYTMGLGPETLAAYFRQQYRWARGTLGVGMRLLGLFLRKPGALSPLQWVDYGLSGTFYLVGWAYLILMLCPIMYVLLGIPSYFVRPEIYAAAFLPYIVFAVLVFVGGLRKRHYTLRQMISGQLLVFLASPVHIRASLTALFGVQSRFGITPKGSSALISLGMLWPQMLLCLVNYLVFLWGICRWIFEADLAAGVNGFWAGVHFAVFWSVLYFREAMLSPSSRPRSTKLDMGLEVAAT
ncbi:MAG TPA: glycosyltransferase [Phycisphaerae bacterium]|nr:glycosyltransferase [Phycisphaerae bacterium]